MLHKKNTKNLSRSVAEFQEYRKGLSNFDKKIEAGLLVEEIKSINVNNAFDKVSNRINTRSKTNRIITSITRVAAVFTLPLLVFTIWSLFSKNNTHVIAENSITWQEIQSPVGMRSHIVLPDGTDLWLNAGSKIRYGIPFIRENRQVDLIGEAFLCVVKNENSPFLVHTGNTDVKVLGTRFNVKAYPEDKQIEVALKKGSVEFYFTKNNGKKVFAKLKPNDYLILNKENNKVTKNNKDITKYISWHENVMIFDDTPMLEVASTLERWYGVKVVIASNEIKNYKFTTTFENEPLFRVLELLELSSPKLSISYTPGKMDKLSKKISHAIVTISKK